MDGDAFRTSVGQVPVAELNTGDIVITDNLPAHKGAGIRDPAEAAEAHPIYLPPYAPGFKPIEMAFSKIKALSTKAAARTSQELEDAITNAIEKFPTNQLHKPFQSLRI